MRTIGLCAICLACLVGTLAGCDLLPQSRSALLLADIEEQERMWQEKDVDSYKIVVSHVRSIWHAQIHEISVSEGKVVDESASCVPAPAESGECRHVRDLPGTDYEHLAGDATRAYNLLAREWLAYMQHLRDNYPCLFSLAMRTNPFDPTATPEVT